MYFVVCLLLPLWSKTRCHLPLDLDSVMALQTDLTSDEELSTTIDLSDAQVKNNRLQAVSCMEKEELLTFTVEYTVP